ncbi:MAG: hypothetical protein C3F11_06280 [Methylocystaceae bacterium]|nr:MAG: hypothetical protein C3F11_06280 [Methylocystaceae bacterium]
MLAGAVAWLFLLQSLAFALSPSGRTVSSNDPQGAALSMVGEFCDVEAHADDKAPSQHHHHHQQCALCVADNRNLSLDDAVAFVATVIVLALPQSRATPAWVCRDESTPPPLGWTSSWSSRAPPFFS